MLEEYSLSDLSVISRRNSLHGWKWPKGTRSEVAKCLGISTQKLVQLQLHLLLKEIRES